MAVCLLSTGTRLLLRHLHGRRKLGQGKGSSIFIADQLDAPSIISLLCSLLDDAPVLLHSFIDQDDCSRRTDPGLNKIHASTCVGQFWTCKFGARV